MNRQAIHHLTPAELGEQYKVLTDKLPLPMLIHAAGIIKFMNPECVKLLGGESAEDFLGASILDVIHPEYQAVALARVQRILQGEQNVESVELKLIRRDGRETWIETTGIAAPFAGEQCIYVIGKDIQDRKQVEAAQQKRLDDLESLYQLSNVVASSDTLEQLYDAAMHAAISILQADRVAIRLLEEDANFSNVAVRGFSANALYSDHQLQFPWGQHVVQPEPVVRRHVAVEGERNNLALVPLVHHGHLIGDVIIGFAESREIGESDLQLAKTIAFHIALGVERKHAESEIYNLAFYDPLTKLPNRRLLIDRIRQAMLLSARSTFHGALIFIDLDYFKNLNDTRGHEMGDLLLTEVAHRLQHSVRDFDTVARLGGDEFVILVEGLSKVQEDAAVQAENLAQHLRGVLSYAYQLQGHEHQITPSIGIALFRGREESVDTLLKHADIAMYQAKAAGRNTVSFYDASMQAALEIRLELENALRKAINQNEFELHYQIQVDQSQRIIGVEALVRWMHPEKGMISPAVFIPLAEETGMILPLGEWILERACLQINAWRAHPQLGRLQVAVNISAVQFNQDDFVARLQHVLAQTGVDPARLKLELTESLMLKNVEGAVQKVTQIKALGVGFSMDDFGTGFSSLSYLKHLPLDQLKIDQSFVRDLESNRSDKAVVQAIMTMGDAFGLEIIAEGVETASQYAHLESMGCTAFQGYLFGKPVPIHELDQVMERMRGGTLPGF